MDLTSDDVLFNSVIVESQLKRIEDGKPWRGPKEKLEVLMKFFVHGFTPEHEIVADLDLDHLNNISNYFLGNFSYNAPYFVHVHQFELQERAIGTSLY